jgi:hypothetical protein
MPSSVQPSLRPRHQQRGLTLVELMVGLTLGLIVISSLLLVLAHASLRGQDLERTSIQVENGRYVAELFREDIRMAGFFGETLRPDPPDLWIPLQQEPVIAGDGSLLHQSISAWLRVIGRLRPGATADGMAPRLTRVLRQWIQYDSGYPSDWMPEIVKLLPKQTLAVVPAGAGVGVMKEEYGRSLQILLAVCGLVLLIACANVANLMLASGLARRRELGVRLALGARRWHIARQLVAETLLLALAGGAGGLALAHWSVRLFVYLAGTQLPRATTIQTDARVFAFAVMITLVVGVLCGIAPLVLLKTRELASAVREGDAP